MFDEFKKEMTMEFEMTDIGLMSYYLSIEVKQEDKGILITQEGYAKEVLKKFKMGDSNPVSTPMECRIKLSKNEEGNKVDPTLYKSLVGSLCYLTCIGYDILYAVRVVSRYMENPTTAHLKAGKRILRYLKGTTDFGLITNLLDMIVNGAEIWMIARVPLTLYSTWETLPSFGYQRSSRLPLFPHVKQSMY